MNVIVVGGGIGGLALAQALRRAGVEVEVYERDTAAGSRWEGYRLHINPAGARALHACLPDGGWREFRDHRRTGRRLRLPHRAARRAGRHRGVDHVPGRGPTRAENHYAADRATLRRVLATGLDDVAALRGGLRRLRGTARRAGARSTSPTAAPRWATCWSAPTAPRSRVRRQLLPDVATVDSGAVGVAHKIWLTDEVRAALPARLLTGMNLITGTRRSSCSPRCSSRPARSVRPTCCAHWSPAPTCSRRTSPRSTATGAAGRGGRARRGLAPAAAPGARRAPTRRRRERGHLPSHGPAADLAARPGHRARRRDPR